MVEVRFHAALDSQFVHLLIIKKKYKKQVIESTADFFSFTYCLSKAEDNEHIIERDALERWADDIWY